MINNENLNQWRKETLPQWQLMSISCTKHRLEGPSKSLWGSDVHTPYRYASVRPSSQIPAIPHLTGYCVIHDSCIDNTI